MFWSNSVTDNSRPVYTGPGDVVSGATGWWGLRAYSAAKIGSNIIRLRENAGNTEQDFAAIAGGGLDSVAITAFQGIAALFVVALYDQSGNGHTATQTTAGNQPPFTLSAIGSLPAASFAAAGNYRLDTDSVAGYTVPTPFSASMVVKNTDNGAPDAIFGGAVGDAEIRINGNVFQLLAENTALLDTGPAVSDLTWLALATTYNAANVAFYVNGTSSSGGADATGITAVGPYQIGRGKGNGEQFNGFINEFGTWGSIFTGAQASNMSTNQRAYWGF